MKSHDKPFDKALYDSCDEPGKVKVMELINKYSIDTNIHELEETPRDPYPDLKGDKYYHEVGVAKHLWKDSNIIPNFLTIVERKRKYFVYDPLFWIVSSDISSAIWLTMGDLYRTDVVIKERRSSKTKAGYEKWIVVPKKIYKRRVLR